MLNSKKFFCIHKDLDSNEFMCVFCIFSETCTNGSKELYASMNRQKTARLSTRLVLLPVGRQTVRSPEKVGAPGLIWVKCV
jgi:hypothetical protein